MRAKTALQKLNPFLLLGALGLLQGCSTEQQVCSTICECEHCNDYEEDLSCAELESDAEVAAAYGCDREWSDYLNCVLDKGECKEDDANYSTEEPGNCGSTQDIGVSCMSSADCAPFGSSATCSGGQCVQKICDGSGGYPCDSDSDCPGGQDRCQEALVELYQCQDKASAHGGVAGVDPQPPPQPGGN